MSDKFGDGRDPYLYPGLNVMRNGWVFVRRNAWNRRHGNSRRYVPPRWNWVRWPAGCRICAPFTAIFTRMSSTGRAGARSGYLSGDTRFCHFEYIEKEGNALMQSLEDEEWLQGLGKEEFIERLAHYYCEINVLHPFRIGNGIAQRIFFEQLALHAGYRLDWRGLTRKAGVKRIRPGRWAS
jgi:cell filamentation protein